MAISDHHDFAYVPYVKEAARDEKLPDGTPVPEAERLVVFPAAELTLSVPCQAIIILDSDFPEDRLDDVLKALHWEPVDPALPVIPQVQKLSDSGDINALHITLDKCPWLKGRYIILPNVSPTGYKSLLRTSFDAKYAEMVCVGGYLDGSIDELAKPANSGDARKLAGRDVNWGLKKLALFQTSDSRSADFASLGQYSTWVKWARPTAEAIRQACLADESRLAQSEPPLPSTWISGISVSSSKFMGRIDVSLNPQYTALIGGRGTGKSTILDYLRWALCDQPAEVNADDEIPDPRNRQRRLVEATLQPFDAVVEVTCVINGILHVVRRSASDGSVQLKVADGEFSVVRESAIQSLLPIQGYSQKQLSSVAIRVDELLRFIETPIRRELEDLTSSIGEITGRLRENYGTLQRQRSLQVEIQKTQVRLQSLTQQALSLRQGLAGLSDDDRRVLDSRTAYDDARTASSTWVRDFQQLCASVAATSESVPEAMPTTGLPETMPRDLDDSVTSLREAIASSLGEIGAALAHAVTIGDAAQLKVSAANGVLSSALDAHDLEYAAVKARSTAHESQLAELAELEKQQGAIRTLLQKQQSELSGLGDPASQHGQLRSELTAAWRERTALLQSQCEQLSDMSDGLIRASLGVGHGLDEAERRFKGLAAGSNVRTAQIESFFEQLRTESSPPSTWEGVLDELELLMLRDSDAEITSEQTPTLSRLGLRVADQKRIMPKLTPDGWLDLSLTELNDTPSFEYRTKEAQYISFEAASAGQQASALLTTLLSQGSVPLIIDQPEDDLDSDTIQQIVSKIWQAKAKRQIVFASHNANLVVNGDADLVLICAYLNTGDQSAGHIKLEGAIDIPAVRDELTTVMEGGERAFKLRKEKYGF
ncbi:MAG: AAA family ATPase [Propionibacteriaceae bacterium]|nr:AAA family ATPase [Propionibacteriaceae bacterium]